MIITRQESIEVLSELICSNILGEELQDKLNDIMGCIEEEQNGRHIWGADEDEVIQFHIAYREDLWTDELQKKISEIDKKLRFIPSEYEEAGLIEDYVRENLDYCEDEKEAKKFVEKLFKKIG